jgi:hypothetical protein
MLANKTGALTAEVISHAVSNWSKFALQATSECGFSSWPEKPHIGFLLAHYDVVVNLMLEMPDYKADPHIQAWLAAINDTYAAPAHGSTDKLSQGLA